MKSDSDVFIEDGDGEEKPERTVFLSIYVMSLSDLTVHLLVYHGRVS